MDIKGDFCYVIWFDNGKDSKFFSDLLRKRGFFVMLSHVRFSEEWAVIWDIGLH